MCCFVRFRFVPVCLEISFGSVAAVAVLAVVCVSLSLSCFSRRCSLDRFAGGVVECAISKMTDCLFACLDVCLIYSSVHMSVQLSSCLTIRLSVSNFTSTQIAPQTLGITVGTKKTLLVVTLRSSASRSNGKEREGAVVMTKWGNSKREEIIYNGMAVKKCAFNLELFHTMPTDAVHTIESILCCRVCTFLKTYHSRVSSISLFVKSVGLPIILSSRCGSSSSLWGTLNCHGHLCNCIGQSQLHPIQTATRWKKDMGCISWWRFDGTLPLI